MSSREDNDDDDELGDREYPDDQDVDDDLGDAPDPDPCPNCGADVYPGAARCPKCGTWLSREDRMIPQASSHRPWVIVTAIIVLVTLLWLWYGGLFL